jgi:hypothetical protein
MRIHNTACALTTSCVLYFSGLLVTEVFLVPEDVCPPVCDLEDTLLQPLQEDAQPDILSGGDGQQAGRHKIPQPFRLDSSNIYKLKNKLKAVFPIRDQSAVKLIKTDKNEVTDRQLYKKSFCTVHAYFCQGPCVLNLLLAYSKAKTLKFNV